MCNYVYVVLVDKIKKTIIFFVIFNKRENNWEVNVFFFSRWDARDEAASDDP